MEPFEADYYTALCGDIVGECDEERVVGSAEIAIKGKKISILDAVSKTIAAARESGAIGDVLIATHAREDAFIELITAAHKDMRFIIAEACEWPSADIANKKIIYIGISFGEQNLHRNYDHLRNINLYRVEYYGMTFAASDSTAEVYIPLNEKSPPTWTRIDVDAGDDSTTARLWLSGATSDLERADDLVLLQSLDINHSQLLEFANAEE